MLRALIPGALLLALAGSASADVTVSDAYLRSAMPAAKTGAAFMVLHNDGAETETLIEVRSDVAARVELHTHVMSADGVMSMVPVEDGIALPAGGEHRLERGGDHVMFMGLLRLLPEGETVRMTLVFASGAEVALEVPVDRSR